MNCRGHFLSLAAYTKICIAKSHGPFGSIQDFLLPKNRIAAIITYSIKALQVFQWHLIFQHRSVMTRIILWQKERWEKQESRLIHCRTWKNCSAEFHFSPSRLQ